MTDIKDNIILMVLEIAFIILWKLKYKEKENAEAKEIIEELIRFQPYIDREAMFHPIGNEWKIAIYKARQFLLEVSK